MKKVLSTLDVTHVIKSPRLIFNGLASSKVIRSNYCTRVNIHKGREPGTRLSDWSVFRSGLLQLLSRDITLVLDWSPLLQVGYVEQQYYRQMSKKRPY